MINAVCVYGSKDSLINLNVENNKLSSNDWTTNCFGLDISALVTDYVSREEESILLKKFYILETSSLYKSYAIEYIKAIVGWISSSMENTTGLLSDLGLASVNSKQLKNLDMKTVEMEFGILDFAKKYSCLRLLPINFETMDEYIYMVDLDRASLNDLPNIYKTSKIMLDYIKSTVPREPFKSIFVNNYHSIMIGQTKTLIKLLSLHDFKDAFSNLKFISNSLNYNPNTIIELQARYKNISLVNIDELKRNEYKLYNC